MNTFIATNKFLNIYLISGNGKPNLMKIISSQIAISDFKD